MFFVLFEAILSAVFKNVIFNPTKIMPGALLSLSLPKKATLGEYDVFIITCTVLLPVKSSQRERHGF
jgi:hypothetical protein